MSHYPHRVPRLACVALLLLCHRPTKIYADDCPPQCPALRLDNPFASDKALSHLFELYPDLDRNVAPVLRRIVTIEYAFERLPNCPIPTLCDPRLLDKPHYKVSRNVVLRLSGLVGAFAAALKANEDHGCSDLVFHNPRRLYVTNAQVALIADFSAHKRACWDFFGPQSTDLGSASGNVIVVGTLRMAPPDLEHHTTRGSVAIEFSKPAVNITNRDLLGFINPESVLGHFTQFLLKVAQVAFDVATFKQVDLKVYELLDQVNKTSFVLDVVYDEAVRAATNPRAVEGLYTKVELIGGKNFYLDTAATALRGAGNETDVAMSYFTLVSELAVGDFYKAKKGQMAEIGVGDVYAVKKRQVELIASLSSDDTAYEVQRGDNLWRVAKRAYGTEGLMYALARYNHIEGPTMTIHPRQTLQLAPLWKLIAESGDLLLRPGDNLWKVHKARCPKADWGQVLRRIPAGSSDVDKVYPWQVGAVCP